MVTGGGDYTYKMIGSAANLTLLKKLVDNSVIGRGQLQKHQIWSQSSEFELLT